MRIITTHTGTDFDALASMVAGAFLYPGAVGVLPSMVNPEVKQFLGMHGDILRIKPRKGFDLDGVTSLIVVDANSWKRLDKMEGLADRDGLEIICWDHHMEGVTIESDETHREEVGAAVTLLLEEMQRRDAAFAPMHATLFLLGIYSDTGGLRYPNVTARDAAMVSYCIENGADLNVVAAYLDDSLDDAHTEVFGRMLEESETIAVGAARIGFCAMQVNSGLTSLATLVGKYREFKGLDAAFGVFQADSTKCMVMGRGAPKRIDVGAVMRALGGGGHPGAGSAVVKGATLEDVAQQVRALILQGSANATPVSAVMSNPGRFMVDAEATLADAAQLLADASVSGLMVHQGDVFLGVLTAPDCAKAAKNGHSDKPVKAYTRRHVPKLHPHTSIREAVALMVSAKESILAVVEDDALIGVVTQTDLLLQVYDF